MRCAGILRVVADYCRLSFLHIIEKRHRLEILKRMICIICIVSISVVSVPFSLLAEAELGQDIEMEQITLYPNGEENPQLIRLRGTIPQGAIAEAVDVTKNYDALAAYDISISLDDEEYEFDEEDTVSVEINNPLFSDCNKIELWNIFDDGERRKINDVSVENGIVRFDTNRLGVYAVVEKKNIDDSSSMPSETEQNNYLQKQSLEVYPNGKKSGQIIKLDGMIPEGACAEAVDVTKELDALAAYDITITDGEEEYQPGTQNPIYVEISNPKIKEKNTLELWHVRDSGEREKISDFILEDGKIGFYATGFSVYEIVEVPIEFSYDIVTSDDELTSVKGSNTGFVLYYGNSKKYITSNVLVNGSNSVLEETSNFSLAAVWYFEKSGSALNMYTYVDGQKKYLHTKSGNNIELSDSADLLDIYEVEGADPQSFFFKQKNANKWIQHSGSGGGIRYYTDNKNTVNSSIFIQYADVTASPSAEEQLDGKTYGLFHYTTGATKGNAFMADGNSHSLIKLIITAQGNNRVMYVDENNEIDRWTFTYDPEDGRFFVSSVSESETKYLFADSTGISTVTAQENASKFDVKIIGESCIQLKTNGVYIAFHPKTEEDGGGVFEVTEDGTNPSTWLYRLDRAQLDDSDLITFSADRVSVSDIKNGQEVIVYMRIWNENELRYDMYAVDHDGSLYPCYASGGKILWLGDGTDSMEWKFIEYVDEVTKEPNYYYELYNPYSEKYLAPQLNGNQVLSDDTIGINMPGRRNGEFYSQIMAWDNSKYAYIGFRPNAEKTALEPCAESVSLPFYFATREELNLSDRLHQVPTVDNNEHGIKMRIVDFGLREGKAYGSSDGADVTWDYLGGSASIDKLTRGLLSPYLKENGYPDATRADAAHKDFAKAFENAMPVNHLFLDKVHESSGYFEFDSCQNFATLKKTNEDGTVSFNTKENGETDFILYRELGTHDRSKTSYSLKHGEFFPFDTILPGVYSQNNPQNLYSSLTSPSDGTMGVLSDDDPRKYEKLHLIQTEAPKEANYYFGLEMESSFVQTPSGLDAWGHDIIFEFTGDDDFWFYVDNNLVLDLGGTHSAVMGTINFRTGDIYYDKAGAKVHGTLEHTTLRQVFEDNYRTIHPGATDEEVNEYMSEYFAEGENIFKDYSTHTMKVFYMERGGNASNLNMRFNIAAVKPGHVVVSKSVSGDGAELIDTDFVEYPFQIYYTLPEGENGGPGEEHLLGNDDDYIAVTYQNSNQPATFVRKYRPPGFTEEEAYSNIYFINPSKSAEIAFPDDTITYRIVECAVDSTVYGTVTINGENVPAERIEVKGDLRSYSSELGSAEKRPNITFDNYVNKDVIKDLYITKKLLDENNNEVTDDSATFNFRLYLSSFDVRADDMQLANMHKYYVLSPNKKMCRFDSTSGKFTETYVPYTHENVEKLKEGTLPGFTVDDLTFTTSGFGAISGIPAGYTICVPGLPVGTIFKVTEDTKVGYGLDGFERVMGSKINDDYTVEDIPSYWEYEGNPINVGKVRAEENPQLEVHNKKGYGLNVKKQWSDIDLTVGHAPIYTAVYVDGELLADSVKQIKSPATTAYYFWTTLKAKDDGTERTNLDDYVVKEVTISNTSPEVLEDGTVTNYGTVTPIEDGTSINVAATRTAAATPEGETPQKTYDYVVTTNQGTVDGTTRTDIISNIRNGGIALRLFKWDSDVKLKGGKFKLTDSTGKVIGEYTSGSDGLITMMYNFSYNEPYTLQQSTAPKGFVGIQKILKFVVNDDDTVSLYYEDGHTQWGNNDAADSNWANTKSGQNGITAFVDVYNKPFNFKIEKMDGEDNSIMLEEAHFALYKQANTSISGYVKNKNPMTGFEDMVTQNGVVDVCGGNSNRVINPGEKGSVYFLTETRAPFNYAKLDEDIIFRVSPIGVPSLISDSYNGSLVETEDSYIYTLSVPNVKELTNVETLTIEKKVAGTGANMDTEFTFTVSINGAGDGEGFVWAKNGVEQPLMSRTGGVFTMKHKDRVDIALPPGVSITVTDDPGEYTSGFKLGEGPEEETDTKTFVLAESTKLLVTNTLDAIVATGITNKVIAVVAGFITTTVIVATLIYRRKRKRLWD